MKEPSKNTSFTLIEMTLYDDNSKELKRNILAQKTIYRFRTFLYSINKDVRHYWFDICRAYFLNEINNNAEMSITERDRVQNLLHHWDWNSFETAGSTWWFLLSMNHSHSITLMTLLHLWIDDIQVFDPEAFETSTLGLS